MPGEFEISMFWTASTGTKRRRVGQRGFTLVEMMIVLSILAILAVIAVPSFNELALRSKLNSISNSFVGSAQLARSEAIKRNAPVTLCASSDGESCGGEWKAGWVVLAGEVLIHSHGPLPVSYELSGNATSVDFPPSGVMDQTDPILLTLENTQDDSQKRFITITVTGRPSVDKTSGSGT